MFKLIAGATGVILLVNPELSDGVDKLGFSFFAKGLLLLSEALFRNL